MRRESPQQAAPPRIESGDAVIAFDPDLRVTSWNGALERLTGLRPQEIEGRQCWEVIRATDESGRSVCRAECPIAEAILAGREIENMQIFVGTAVARRLARLSSLRASCGDGELLFHVIHLVEAGARATGSGPPPGAPLETLTPRQTEILKLLAEGVGTRAIASRLEVSTATVRNHVRMIFTRLGCRSRLEAVAVARRRGLI